MGYQLQSNMLVPISKLEICDQITIRPSEQNSSTSSLRLQHFYSKFDLMHQFRSPLHSEMDMTMTQYKDAFDPRMSPENVSERLETVNYQIALAIRAGLPVEELQKEQKELQLKVRKR